ncbi:MAG: hypothetical protein SGPRY_007073 [Prymnesium sp.]
MPESDARGAFICAMEERTPGENGAPELTARALSNPLLALFFKLVRDLPDDSLCEQMREAVVCARDGSEHADLFVLAFHTRATRGIGKGEKALFYKMLSFLDPLGVEATLHLIPHFGYWKDLLLMQEVPQLSAALKNKAIAIFAEQLRTDAMELKRAEEENRVPSLSLCGKYAPREGSHFDKGGLKLARELATRLHGSANVPAAQRKYRQLTSKLNAALKTTEVLMSANRFEEIEFSRVASLCMQRCRKAFMNEKLTGEVPPRFEETGNRHPEDKGRVAARQALREAVAKKKVNGKQLFPHEITRKLMASGTISKLEVDLMEAQWTALRESTREMMAAAAKAREEAMAEGGRAPSAGPPKAIDLGKLVALVDVSGSMHGTPMEVAIALGILVSELSAPHFRDRVLTFESQPRWVDLSSCTNIQNKVRELVEAPWGGSTNFEAASEMILHAAERARLKPDDIPDLIVFSDMQFNVARGHPRSSWETHHERLVKLYAEVGRKVCGEPYAAPRIIYWNLRGNTVGFPVDGQAANTQMLSGFSPSLLKLVLSGADLIGDEVEVVTEDGEVQVVREGPTPAETVRQALDDSAFDAVRLALAGVKEGPLAAYALERDGYEIV